MVGQSVLFDLRKTRGISFSMATLFQNPSLREFASVIDAASTLSNGDKSDSTPPEMDYHLDGELLKTKYLPAAFPQAHNPAETFLVTGASGFLGAHILADLLNRPHTKVIALVRAKDSSDALQRVKENCIAYGIWSKSWPSRLECIPGDLSKPNLGLSPTTWKHLEDSVDVIIHSGARVHWIHTYTEMKPTNVLATLACITLCSTPNRPKHLTFISSTAVLDTPSHLNHPVLESDDLSGSRRRLSTGYAQTKYVSEYLVREAGTRGLRGCIVRAGYLTGNQTTGIGPTDDFLLRMLKGSIQLHSRPDLSPNSINLVPISHCARIVVAASLHPPSRQGVDVVQVTPHPQLPWNDFLGALEVYGYDTPMIPYSQWKSKLEEYVANPTTTTSSSPAHPNGTTPAPSAQTNEPHALLPLFDWVTSDLPSSTQSRSLDDSNAQKVVNEDDPTYPFEEKGRVDEGTVGVYLGFMREVGFIGGPEGAVKGEGKGERERKELPRVEMGEEMMRAWRGRGGR